MIKFTTLLIYVGLENRDYSRRGSAALTTQSKEFTLLPDYQQPSNLAVLSLSHENVFLYNQLIV
jgi:hypothetical protein